VKASDEALDRRAFLARVARRGAIAAGSLALGLVADGAWARAVRGPRLERKQYPRLVVGRWRVHHNVLGWAALVAGAFVYPFVLVPFGLGMIVGHGLRDRLFWFLERVR
jgi:hypothetical protein